MKSTPLVRIFQRENSGSKGFPALFADVVKESTSYDRFHQFALSLADPVFPEPVGGAFPRVQILAQSQEGIKLLKVPLINNRADIAPHFVICVLGGRLRIYPK